VAANRYGERFWQQLRGQIANASLQTSDVPPDGKIVPLLLRSETATPTTTRPNG
jgi:hypothetical protein